MPNNVQIDGVGQNICTAERAVCVRPQPGINARNMKCVAALGQEPKRLVFLKFVQTNGTLRPFDQPFVLLVLTDRNRAYYRLLQSDGGDEPDGMIDLSLIKKILICAVGLGGYRGPVISPAAAPTRTRPCYDNVVANKNKNAGQERKRDDEVGGDVMDWV